MRRHKLRQRQQLRSLPLLVCLALASDLYAQPGPEIPAAVAAQKPNIVRIWEDGNRGRGIGSGIYLGCNHVLTCQHVIRDAPQRADRKQICNVIFTDGTVAAGVVVCTDTPYDVAVIQVDRAPDNLPEVKWAPSNPQPGEPVYSIGAGSTGSLAYVARRVIGYVGPAGRRPDWFEMTSPARGGDSGCPIFDAEGRLIGPLWGSGATQAQAVGVMTGRTYKTVQYVCGPGQACYGGPGVVMVRPAPSRPIAPPTTTAPPTIRPPVTTPPAVTPGVTIEALLAAMAKDERFRGPAGAPGAPGEPGEPGPPGPPGEKGEQGETGQAGSGDVDHAQLARLVAVQLSRDPEFVSSCRGEQGRPGPSGPAGPPGPPGQAGERGPEGIAGPPGQNGAQGEQGIRGPPGEIGQPGRTPEIDELERRVESLAAAVAAVSAEIETQAAQLDLVSSGQIKFRLRIDDSGQIIGIEPDQ